MQQLTGMDQLFLGLETSTTNCIVGALTVFEPPAEGQPVPDAEFMITRLADRVEYVPPFHMVLVKTPLGLDHDYLAEAEHIDVAPHVSTVRLPAPGTQQQFHEMLGRLMEMPLDHSRPMWDFTVIEGLQDGSMAHLLRFSHGVVDGSLMTKIYNLVSDSPGELVHPDTKVAHKEPRFGKPEMLARGVYGLARRPFQVVSLQVEGAKWMIQRFPQDGVWTMPALMARMIPGELGRPLTSLINVRQRARGRSPITPYYPTLLPPRTPINGHVSANRQVALVDLELADFKEITHGWGTTLNNAVLAVVAGALRRYLAARDILPKRPLIVCVPVSLRTGQETEPWANYVNMINAPLPTHLGDPLARLRTVIDEMKLAKGSFDGMPTHLMRDASRLSWRDSFGLMSTLMAKVPNALSVPQYNVTVSNVRGPEQVNTINGLKVAGYYPISFLTPGGGINLSLWSYQDHLFFGIVGAPEQVDDLQPLTEFLRESLAELVDAVNTYTSDGRVAAALTVVG